MSELKKGMTVHLTDGGTAVVEKELGRGGQGIVYAVKVGDKRMALKWYTIRTDDRFYDNLAENIRNGAPSDVFLWPQHLTRKEYGSFGYIMKLRPEGYYEFTSYLRAQHSFDSYHAITVAAMEICEGFKALHALGLSYQDLNDGNFFIDPKTGHVLIVDNDNVYPHREKSGIMGKARFMAPEVVASQNPNAHSDKFSLAVILFLLFCGNHPFEGARVTACPCLTEEYEKRFYGSEILFIYDPDDSSNRPVRGVHSNVLRHWPTLPGILRRTFITEFSKDRLLNPTRRLTELQWQSVITAVRDNLVICPHCGEETYIDGEKGCHCMNCRHTFDVPNILQIESRRLALTKGNLLYIDRDEIPDVEVIQDKADKSMLLLKNISGTKWSVDTPSGRTKIVSPGEVMPVKKGLIVTFGSFNKKGTIL